jgi:hypothetical protein
MVQNFKKNVQHNTNFFLFHKNLTISNQRLNCNKIKKLLNFINTLKAIIINKKFHLFFIDVLLNYKIYIYTTNFAFKMIHMANFPFYS